jgi:hypothetical protein
MRRESVVGEFGRSQQIRSGRHGLLRAQVDKPIGGVKNPPNGTTVARRRAMHNRIENNRIESDAPTLMNSPSEDYAVRTGISGPLHVEGARLRDIERVAIERTLAHTGNNQSKAARILGISRPTLLRKLKGYRVEDAAAELQRSADAAKDFDSRCCAERNRNQR